MKALKSLFVCLLLALSSAAFVGCDKDKDNDGSNSIVGTWRWSDEYSYDIITFTSNGTYTSRYGYYGVEDDIYTDYGRYEYKAPYLRVFFNEDGYEESVTVYVTIKGDTMVFDGDIYYRQ